MAFMTQTSHKLNACCVCHTSTHLLACACTHIFVYYVDTCVAACYTTQSHANACVIQVFNNAHQSINHMLITLFTSPVLYKYRQSEQRVIVTMHTDIFVRCYVSNSKGSLQ